MDINHLSREHLMFETERLSKAIRFSRLKVLIELLVVTIVVVFWWPTVAIRFEGPMYRTMVLMIPPILNTGSWFFWIVLSYFSGFMPIKYDPKYRGIEDDMLYRFDALQFTLRKQKRNEMIFDILVGLQFIFITFTYLSAMIRL